MAVFVPIYDGGTNKAKKERAMIAVQTIDIQKKQLENLIRFEVDNARKQYINAQERVRNQQKNLDLAQRIYDATQTKYKAGVGSSFEITGVTEVIRPSSGNARLVSFNAIPHLERSDRLGAVTHS